MELGVGRGNVLGCVIVGALFLVLVGYSPQLAGVVGLGGMAIVLLVNSISKLLERPRTRTRAEVAAILREFLEDPSPDECYVDGSFWDEFTRRPIRDARLDEIRRRCSDLETEFPSKQSSRLCSDEGERVVRQFIRELESPE